MPGASSSLIDYIFGEFVKDPEMIRALAEQIAPNIHKEDIVDAASAKVYEMVKEEFSSGIGENLYERIKDDVLKNMRQDEDLKEEFWNYARERLYEELTKDD